METYCSPFCLTHNQEKHYFVDYMDNSRINDMYFVVSCNKFVKFKFKKISRTIYIYFSKGFPGQTYEDEDMRLRSKRVCCVSREWCQMRRPGDLSYKIKAKKYM